MSQEAQTQRMDDCTFAPEDTISNYIPPMNQECCRQSETSGESSNSNGASASSNTSSSSCDSSTYSQASSTFEGRMKRKEKEGRILDPGNPHLVTVAKFDIQINDSPKNVPAPPIRTKPLKNSDAAKTNLIAQKLPDTSVQDFLNELRNGEVESEEDEENENFRYSPIEVADRASKVTGATYPVDSSEFDFARMEARRQRRSAGLYSQRPNSTEVASHSTHTSFSSSTTAKSKNNKRPSTSESSSPTKKATRPSSSSITGTTTTKKKRTTSTKKSNSTKKRSAVRNSKYALDTSDQITMTQSCRDHGRIDITSKQKKRHIEEREYIGNCI